MCVAAPLAQGGPALPPTAVTSIKESSWLTGPVAGRPPTPAPSKPASFILPLP